MRLNELKCFHIQISEALFWETFEGSQIKFDIVYYSFYNRADRNLKPNLLIHLGKEFSRLGTDQLTQKNTALKGLMFIGDEQKILFWKISFQILLISVQNWLYKRFIEKDTYFGYRYLIMYEFVFQMWEIYYRNHFGYSVFPAYKCFQTKRSKLTSVS